MADSLLSTVIHSDAMSCAYTPSVHVVTFPTAIICAVKDLVFSLWVRVTIRSCAP